MSTRAAFGAALAAALLACGGNGTAPTANEPPTASFSWSPESPFQAELVVFEAEAADPDGTVRGLAWDFGDGGTGAGATVEHVFADPGPHTVRLTATDDDGATATVTGVVPVAEALDFGAIAGFWHGDLDDADPPQVPGRISLRLGTTPGPTRVVGSVTYWRAGRLWAKCEGVFRAIDGEGRRYDVKETTHGTEDRCGTVSVRLEHDPAAGTLTYAKVDGVLSGTLARADSLSFAPIAGRWSGPASGVWMGRADNFDMEVVLQASAVQGEAIGTVGYFGEGGDDCTADWIGLEVEGNVYRMTERQVSGAGCPPGNVRLEYDPQAGTLSYSYVDIAGLEHTADATLSRGG